MRKRNLPVNTLLTPEALVGVADDLNFPNADAVFAAIGDGQVSTQNVISHLVRMRVPTRSMRKSSRKSCR